MKVSACKNLKVLPYTHLSSSRLVSHKAFTEHFHLSLSDATARTSFHVLQPASFLSISTVRLQVVFDLPLFLFPPGAQVMAMLQWLFGSCLRMWPIIFHLRRFTSLLSWVNFDVCNSSSLLTWSCHLIRWIRRKHPLLNTSNFLSSPWFILKVLMQFNSHLGKLFPESIFCRRRAKFVCGIWNTATFWARYFFCASYALVPALGHSTLWNYHLEVFHLRYEVTALSFIYRSSVSVLWGPWNLRTPRANPFQSNFRNCARGPSPTFSDMSLPEDSCGPPGQKRFLRLWFLPESGNVARKLERRTKIVWPPI